MMRNRTLKFVVLLLVLSQILSACAPAATPTQEVIPEATTPPTEPVAEVEPTKEIKPTAEPTAVPEPTTPPEPIDLTIWLQATVTEAGAPPDDWIAYQIIHDELNINLTYVIMPTGADGEAKLNAAAAANDLPDFFQMVSASNDDRGSLFRLVDWDW
jgi:ABC-type glycerol-3-phosphate transport system substrate-binding protein